MLIDGVIPLLIDNSPLILIGKGAQPNLWLQVPNSEKKWKFVIEKNVSKDQNIRVIQFEKYLTVYQNKLIILHAVEENKDTINITHIDLDDFGVLVNGDLFGLNVGNNRYSKNVFKGVKTMINIS
jgi:hypothetical protein